MRREEQKREQRKEKRRKILEVRGILGVKIIEVK